VEAGEGCEDMVSGCSFSIIYFPYLSSFSAFNAVLLFVCAHIMVYLCKTTLVKCRYKEDDFENDHAAPYQVVLDTGGLIYAPSE
jgi:hypothetical protein